MIDSTVRSRGITHLGREARVVADRVELLVLLRPDARLGAQRDRRLEMLHRRLELTGHRLHACEVVERRAVARMVLRRLADRRERPLAAAGGPFAARAE